MLNIAKCYRRQHDVTHTSIAYDPSFTLEDSDTVRAVFWGLGGDGTVSANKNSIKIIGEDTDNHAQGYFVYDSKKSGSMTESHLRFGPDPIRSTYLVDMAPKDQRAAYAAVSNTVIGLLLLLAGVLGGGAALIGAEATLMLFAVMALAAAVLAHWLPEVEHLFED